MEKYANASDVGVNMTCPKCQKLVLVPLNYEHASITCPYCAAVCEIDEKTRKGNALMRALAGDHVDYSN